METVLRVLLSYVFIVFGLRVAGKRTFGEMSPGDLVVLMLIPDIFQQAISREDFSMTNAILAVSTLLLAAFILETLSHRFPRVDTVVNGRPVTVVSHGSLRTDHMDLERLSPDEVLDAMHRAGLERMEQVKWAVLYPDGTIAVVPWEARVPQGQSSASDRGAAAGG